MATRRGCPPLTKSAYRHLFAMSFKGMAFAHWLKTEYSRITRQAVAEGAEIYWGDKTSQITSDLRGRGCAPPQPHAGAANPIPSAIGALRLGDREHRSAALHGAQGGHRCADTHHLLHAVVPGCGADRGVRSAVVLSGTHPRRVPQWRSAGASGAARGRAAHRDRSPTIVTAPPRVGPEVLPSSARALRDTMPTVNGPE